MNNCTRVRQFAASTICALACLGLWQAEAQTWTWSDTFDGTTLTGWEKGIQGWLQNVNQQIVLSGTFGPTPGDYPAETYVLATHAITHSGPLADQHTLQATVDLLGANQKDAYGHLEFFWSGDGSFRAYAMGKSEDQIVLLKAWGVPPAMAYLWATNQTIKNTNVAMELSLTRVSTDLRIRMRVLDKDNGNAVLFDTTVAETPKSDPVAPKELLRGLGSVADPVGAAWPVSSAPDSILLGMAWVNTTNGTAGPATVTFDNVQVREFESPMLATTNAIVLSWPVTTGQFVLESAASKDGPWTPIDNPWSRTISGRNEVSVAASDSIRFFRLRAAP